MAGHHWGTQAAQDSCIEIVGLAVIDVAADGWLADHGVCEIVRRTAGWALVCGDPGTRCPDRDALTKIGRIWLARLVPGTRSVDQGGNPRDEIRVPAPARV